MKRKKIKIILAFLSNLKTQIYINVPNYFIEMKFLFIKLCIFLLIFPFIENMHLRDEKKNYPEVHVRMEPSTFDLKDLQIKSEDKRAQRNMMRDLEEKLSLDKQAFQQVTSIQNDEIQQLSEAIKLNSYYTMRKIMNTKENSGKNDNKLKDQKEMTIEKKIELISNPYDVVKDENMKETLDKIPRDRLETYGDIVDKIYGG